MPSLLVSAVMFVASVVVEAGPQDDASSRRAAVPGDLLAGPAVNDESDAGSSGGRRRGDGPATKPREWFAILKDLDLTRAQRAHLAVVRREYQEVRRGFERPYGDRMRELVKAEAQARQERRDLPEPQRRELERLRAIRPSVVPYQMRIWASLDESQRTKMRKALAELRARKRAARQFPRRPGDDMRE